MIKKSKCKFNTSGPNRPEKHYTLKREYLIEKGIPMVEDECITLAWHLTGHLNRRQFTPHR